MRTLLFIAPVFFIACVDGGADKQNGDIHVKDMSPDMAVISQLEVGGSHVDVVLKAGDQNYEMQKGDKLTVVAGDTPAVELRDLQGRYGADLEIKDAGTPVTISFEGANGDKAPASNVVMTEQLGIGEPLAGTSFSRANDPIVVTWGSDPSQDPLQVSWSGPCVEQGSLDVGHNDLTATIPAGSLHKTADGDDSCEISVSITRTRTGELDPAFGGGTITHSFSSSSHVTSTP